MPRRSANKSGSPIQRRQSARIAAAGANKTPTESPVKKTRRSLKRSSSGRAEPVEGNIEQNGAENSTKEVPALEEPAEKKAKTDESLAKQGETPKAGEEEVHNSDSPKKDIEAVEEAGFEVIDKSSVPAPESEDVKEAISAQGEDGQLLVNYVQVSKDEVPAETGDQGVVKNDAQPTNGSEHNEPCKGDANATENSNGDAVTSESKQDEVLSEKPPSADVSQ